MRAICLFLIGVFAMIPCSAQAAGGCTPSSTPKSQEGILVITGSQNDFFYLDGEYHELATDRTEFSCPVGWHQLELANSPNPVPVKIVSGRYVYKRAYHHLPRDNAQLREPLLKALREQQLQRAEQYLRAAPELRNDPDVRWGLAFNHEAAGRRVEAIQNFEFYLRHSPKKEYWPQQRSHARKAMAGLRRQLGRLLLFAPSHEQVYVENEQRDGGSYVWLEPGTYEVKFPDGAERKATIEPGMLTFLHAQDPNELLPPTQFAPNGERTVGQQMALWLIDRVDAALSNGDSGLVDDLLSEVRLLWPDGAYVQRASDRAAHRLDRTLPLDVLVAPGVPYRVDRARHAGSGTVKTIWVRPGEHEVTSGGKTVRVDAESPGRSVNLMHRGYLEVEAGLVGGGRTLLFGSSVSCFDLERITPGTPGPGHIYRRTDCPWYQSGGIGFRVELTLFPFAWAQRLGSLGIGGSFESTYFAAESGRSLQTEIGLRWNSSGFAARRRPEGSTQYLIQYVRREFTSQSVEQSFPFDLRGDPLQTVGTAGLPSVIYHSVEIGIRTVQGFSPDSHGFLPAELDLRLRLLTIPDGEMAQGFHGTGAISGGYGFGFAPLPGFRLAITPLAWAHHKGIAVSLRGYVEGNFIGTSDNNLSRAEEFSTDGQFLQRTNPSRYVALNTGPLAQSKTAATVIDLYYGGLLTIGYHH